ncbi:MAG: hypothetical protein FWG10_12155 [Eubacteriaceae bacterium]|nr:hypothetical protein [Eubacteriaceae bacterium]
MSMPEFLDSTDLTVEDAIVQIISSIAVEELALSHILNAEGEKLQYVLGTIPDQAPLAPNPTFSEIIETNESVKEMVSTVSMSQMFLLGKLSSAMSAYKTMTSGGGDNSEESEIVGPGEPRPPGLEVTDTIPIVDDSRTGDGDWIPIATYGDFILMVRARYINIYQGAGHDNEVAWQSGPYGATNSYPGSSTKQRSKVCTDINNWFMRTAQGASENLSEIARIRAFTVRNNAVAQLGSGTAESGSGSNDGFSYPDGIFDPQGQDVAFALSYGEAVNFISRSYMWAGGISATSPLPAEVNFAKLQITGNTASYKNEMWLRSPGLRPDMACSMSNVGLVFQQVIHSANTRELGLTYPAVWVHKGILEYPTESRLIVNNPNMVQGASSPQATGSQPNVVQGGSSPLAIESQPNVVQGGSSPQAIESQPNVVQGGSSQHGSQPSVARGGSSPLAIETQPNVVQGGSSQQAIESQPNIVQGGSSPLAIVNKPNMVQGGSSQQAIGSKQKIVQGGSSQQAIESQPNIIQGASSPQAIGSQPSVVQGGSSQQAIGSQPNIIQGGSSQQAIGNQPSVVQGGSSQQAIESQPKMVQGGSSPQAICSQPNVVQGGSSPQAIGSQPNMVQGGNSPQAI